MAVDILKLKKLRIGGHHYSIIYRQSRTIVRLVKKHKVKNTVSADGFYDPDTNRIYIAVDLVRSVQCVTWFHEVLHAIETILGIDLGARRVVQLSEQIYAVLKNNGIIR